MGSGVLLAAAQLRCCRPAHILFSVIFLHSILNSDIGCLPYCSVFKACTYFSDFFFHAWCMCAQGDRPRSWKEEVGERGKQPIRRGPGHTSFLSNSPPCQDGGPGEH